MYKRFNRNQKMSFFIEKKNKTPLWIGIITALLVAVIALTVMNVNNANYRKEIDMQLKRRVIGAVMDAVEQANRLPSGVQSDTFSKIALIRQNVYLLDQLNAMSISISGEKARLVPAEALHGLYEDINTYEKLLQMATSSTLEIRSTLITHLTLLQNLIR